MRLRPRLRSPQRGPWDWKGLQSGPKLRRAGWAFACPTWTRRCARAALGPDSSLTKVIPEEGMMLACAHGSTAEGPLVQSDVKCILQWQGTHLPHSPAGLAEPYLDSVSIPGVHSWCQGYKQQRHRSCHRPDRLKRPDDSMQCDSAWGPGTGHTHSLK